MDEVIPRSHTEREVRCLKALTHAWDCFRFGDATEDEKRAFEDAIFEAKTLVARQMARRAHPELY
jgi:hypothetical protein